MTNFATNFSGGVVAPIDMFGTVTPDTGALAPSTGGTAYAKYVGVAPKNLLSVDAFFYVHGVAAVGTGWAEIALYTSPPVTHANYDSSLESISLTPAGYSDISTEVKVASTTGYWKQIPLSTYIEAGTPLWVGVAGLFSTTQASYRTFNQGIITGDAKTLADGTGVTTRPSTNLGTARSFSGNVGAVVVCPVMFVRCF